MCLGRYAWAHRHTHTHMHIRTHAHTHIYTRVLEGVWKDGVYIRRLTVRSPAWAMDKDCMCVCVCVHVCVCTSLPCQSPAC